MAYLDVAANEALGLRERSALREIRLGDAERRVILGARRDVQSGRAGSVLPDPRLEALRRYAMLDRRTADAGRRLQAADFSAAERRIVDAMIGTLPARARPAKAATGRLICAAAILTPLLIAIGAYSWATMYLQDTLIAVVLGGLASLVVLPLAGAVTAPKPRRGAHN